DTSHLGYAERPGGQIEIGGRLCQPLKFACCERREQRNCPHVFNGQHVSVNAGNLLSIITAQSSLHELGSSIHGSFFELLPEIVGTPKLSSGKQPAAMPIRCGRVEVYQKVVVPPRLQN